MGAEKKEGEDGKVEKLISGNRRKKGGGLTKP